MTGWALLLWYQGQATVGTVAAATALVLRLNNMTYWIMWAMTIAGAGAGRRARGDGDDRPADHADRCAGRQAAATSATGRIEIDGVSHHYGRGSGGLARCDR